ncbi:hypothetical protein A9O67_11380 [Tepidimonas fonticaldi]|uniref:Acyltransferase n=1 Tax=Tepidimonas fonticaldi TaxID=1101373 RepID=A0A1A6DYI6_9BURK|nr:hypothetical protein A9O67_11380 [Tepidimonas fonticaldi]
MPSHPQRHTPADWPQRNQRFDTLRLVAALFVLWSHAYPLAGQGEREPLARLTGLDTLCGLGVAIFFRSAATC